MNISLNTERLTIRSIRADDLADFLEYRSDPAVCEFQGFRPMTEERARKFIQSVKNARFGQAGEWIQLCVELKSERKVIGDIGLKPESYDIRVVEFGISFSVKYQKKGYAREALTGIFDLLFEKVGTHRIIGITDVNNQSCIRLLENLKFRREAEFKESFWDEGKNRWRDEYLYAMLEDQWAVGGGQ
ncbi:MAG: GNAT family protein [Pyrinomonadaceae bacterium]